MMSFRAVEPVHFCAQDAIRYGILEAIILQEIYFNYSHISFININDINNFGFYKTSEGMEFEVNEKTLHFCSKIMDWQLISSCLGILAQEGAIEFTTKKKDRILLKVNNGNP